MMTLRKVVASLFGTSPSVSSQEEPSKIAIPQTYLLQAYKSEQHNGFFRRFQVASSFTNPFAAALFGVGVFSLEKALESSQLSKEALRRLAPLFGLKFFDGACLKPTTFSTEQGKFVVWSPPDTDAQMRYDQMGNPWPGRTLSVNEREKLLNHLQLIDPKAKMDADGITIYEHLDAFSDDHWVDT
ncbi:MAG: hypothetical protein LBH53_00520, partial [Puniceicoccales bacterium]|nr:hypothetical protein [Puniceicoccales bacterium]